MHGFIIQPGSMCSKRRDITEQRVVKGQETKALIGRRTITPRLRQHIGDRGRKRGILVVGMTPRNPVTQAVFFTNPILTNDLRQVLLIGINRFRHHFMQPFRLPVWQNEHHGRYRQGAANEGICQSW
ncbi:Uncharacterised protein [Vibrio cholerae]|nr:Uncharacterised protein [Vibrio cholerae]